nr:exosome complex exonuclease RRP46 homolog [Ipomoea batatas]
MYNGDIIANHRIHFIHGISLGQAISPGEPERAGASDDRQFPRAVPHHRIPAGHGDRAAVVGPTHEGILRLSPLLPNLPFVAAEPRPQTRGRRRRLRTVTANQRPSPSTANRDRKLEAVAVDYEPRPQTRGRRRRRRTRGVLNRAHGSASWSQGDTKFLAAVYGPKARTKKNENGADW